MAKQRAIVELPEWVAATPEEAVRAVTNMLIDFDTVNKGQQVEWRVIRASKLKAP